VSPGLKDSGSNGSIDKCGSEIYLFDDGFQVFLRELLTMKTSSSRHDRRIGLDLLVYTPDEFNMLAKEPSSFISSAVKHGVKIYDRKAS